MCHELTYQDRKDTLALFLFLFITEKRDDTIKARLVGDGSKQQTHDRYDESKSSLPTCATVSTFLTGVIDTRERRVVAMLDTENAFLREENDKKVREPYDSTKLIETIFAQIEDSVEYAYAGNAPYNTIQIIGHA